MGARKAEDLMIDVLAYPHIPHWFTLRQAVGMIQSTLLGKDKCVQPMAVLVFDEEYNLMGTLAMRDILRGLEPRFLEPSARAQGVSASEEDLTLLWGSLFTEEIGERAGRQVREVMRPVKHVLAPEDDVAKIAYLLVREDLVLLPVIKDGRIVGLVRMIEVFQEVAGILLTPQAEGGREGR